MTWRFSLLFKVSYAGKKVLGWYEGTGEREADAFVGEIWGFLEDVECVCVY